MCGISAIASHRAVSASLLQCLKNLEYRGYDSCGMAILQEQAFELRKDVGHVAEVDEKVHFVEIPGTLGIAHTRWATHGEVSAANSHPHLSQDEQFVVVHNGIIANHHELRQELTDKGYAFRSDTDTEVLSVLLEDLYLVYQDVEKTFVAALKRLRGSYAVAMMSLHWPGFILGAKKDSPLVLGIGDGEYYLTSDINAYIQKTRDTLVLDDMEYLILSRQGYEVRSLADGTKRQKEVIQVQWDKETAQMGGYSHFMLKEIFDQPQSIKNALSIDEQEITQAAESFLNPVRCYLCGVGTTYYVAMIGSYLFRHFANQYAPAISSDEYPLLIPQVKEQHTLFFSQSGETYDTRMAIKATQAAGGTTGAVVNVVGSSISQMVDHCIFQGSGAEICVVSTKAAVTQIVVVFRIALKTGVLNGTVTAEHEERLLRDIQQFSGLLEDTINEESGFIRNLAKKTSHINHWLFMGKDIFYPVALESALKMKEVTYLHAEGLPAGFLKHGTLAMVDPSVYSLFFLPSKEETELYQSSLSAVAEVKARGGVVIGFAAADDLEAKQLLDHCIVLPELPKELYPLMQMILAQLFSYYSALHLGLNIDKPRNLAKSVTVG